jgi:ubiquinone/menaquinone biosynthesis C-methylase UbiE
LSSELYDLKKKILSVEPSRYWGDDFDVRYYAVSKLKWIKNASILDAGGGIGIISSELDNSNNRVNLDLGFNELRICRNKIDSNIKNVNGVINTLPFKDSSFDHIVCCHILDFGKSYDLKNDKVIEESIRRYPTVEHILSEFRRVLKTNGKLTLTVPNNAYYKASAFEYMELKTALESSFPDHVLYFFNTLPKIGNSRKMNMANMFPKISSKILGRKAVLERLAVKDDGKQHYSISFYVEAVKC